MVQLLQTTKLVLILQLERRHLQLIRRHLTFPNGMLVVMMLIILQQVLRILQTHLHTIMIIKQ